MGETIVIEGVKYILKKHKDKKMTLQYLYLRSIEKTLESLTKKGIKVKFDKNLFKKTMQDLFIMLGYQGQTLDRRKELFVAYMQNREVLTFIKGSEVVTNIEDINFYLALIFTQMYRLIKEEITKEEIAYRDVTFNQLEAINNKMDIILGEKQQVNDLKTVINIQEATIRDLVNKANIRENVFMESSGLDDLLEANSIADEITHKLRDDLELAFEWYSKGGYSNALTILNKYKDILINNHIFNYAYANTLHFLGDYDTAIHNYRKIVENKKLLGKYSSDRLKKLYLFFGNSLYHKKEYWDAYNQYLMSYHYDNKFVDAIFNLGLTKFYISYLPEEEFIVEYLHDSKIYFEKTIELEKGHAQAYYNIGIVNRILGEIDCAIENLLVASKLTKSTVFKIDCYNEIITCYLIDEDDKRASRYVEFIEKEIESVKLTKESRLILAKYYQTKGVYYMSLDFDLSIQCYYEAFKVLPNENTENSYLFHRDNAHHFIINTGKKSVIRSAKR